MWLPWSTRYWLIDARRDARFEEFSSSFYCGSRSDPNFKVLNNMEDEDAASSLHNLLRKVGKA